MVHRGEAVLLRCYRRYICSSGHCIDYLLPSSGIYIKVDKEMHMLL